MQNKPHLLASSGSLQGVCQLILQFYCGTSIDLIPNGKIWNVQRVSDGKILDGVQVVQKGRRYRFEMVRP